MEGMPPDNGYLPPLRVFKSRQRKRKSISIVLSSHKSTVISIELRRTFSTPQNRLKQGIQAYNKPRHRVLLRKSDPATLNMAVDFFIIRWYN